MNSYNHTLSILSSSPQYLPQLLQLLNEEISLPNLPTKTAGGTIFWNTISEHNGWKLQQNMLSHHARILNPQNVRVAWGTFNGMTRAMDRLSGHFR